MLAMLNEQERRELWLIEDALAREDPRLAETLVEWPRPSHRRRNAWIALGVATPLAAGIIHIGLAILLTGVAVIILVMLSLIKT
jgi:hypothetical protein